MAVLAASMAEPIFGLEWGGACDRPVPFEAHSRLVLGMDCVQATEAAIRLAAVAREPLPALLCPDEFSQGSGTPDDVGRMLHEQPEALVNALKGVDITLRENVPTPRIK